MYYRYPEAKKQKGNAFLEGKTYFDLPYCDKTKKKNIAKGISCIEMNNFIYSLEFIGQRLVVVVVAAAVVAVAVAVIAAVAVAVVAVVIGYFRAPFPEKKKLKALYNTLSRQSQMSRNSHFRSLPTLFIKNYHP